MKLKRAVLLLLIGITLHPCAGGAFVPQTPHLLHLVIQSIRQPAGAVAFQTKTLTSGTLAAQIEPVTVREKLAYLSPNQIRLDSLTGGAAAFSLESGFNFIRVAAGHTVARSKSFLDFYTDALFYRDYESFSTRLSLSGIDVSQVTLQRFEDRIYWVVGAPGEPGQPFPGLWIEKESFRPVRYLVRRGEDLVESRYSGWRKISQSWFPSQIRIFTNDQLSAVVEMGDIRLETGFEKGLFDLDRAAGLYPEIQPLPKDPDTGSGDELDRRIEEFNKLLN